MEQPPQKLLAPQEVQGDYTGDYDEGQFELNLILKTQLSVFVEGTIQFDLVGKKIVPIKLLKFEFNNRFQITHPSGILSIKPKRINAIICGCGEGPTRPIMNYCSKFTI